ncbi:MAG: hypothetical protein ABI992_03235 [Chthoniobacterales bacterium]
MSASKNKKSANADEAGTQKQGRTEKLIRLDDLIPKGNVTGGRKLLFGATDTQQQNKPKSKD